MDYRIYEESLKREPIRKRKNYSPYGEPRTEGKYGDSKPDFRTNRKMLKRFKHKQIEGK